MSFLKTRRKASRSSSEPPSSPSEKDSVAVADQHTKTHRQSPLSKSKARLSSLLSSTSLASQSRRKSTGPSTSRSKDSTPSASRQPSMTPSLTSKPSSVRASTTEDSVDDLGIPAERNAARLPLGHDTGFEVARSKSSPNEDLSLVGIGNGNAIPTIENGLSRQSHRSVSLYSEWSEAGAESSDSDFDCFQTPSEGLSEVEEGEEDNEDLSQPQKAFIAQGSEGLAPSTSVSSADTPSSAIHRSVPTASASAIPRLQAPAPGLAEEIDQAAVLPADLRLCAQILTLFLTSRMKDAEELCYRSDPSRQHMYLLSAGSIMNGLKGMMTFDSADLAAALEICKGTAILSQSLRRPVGSLASRLSGLVRSTSVAAIRSMTVLERHAELVYAETSLMKAVLAIVSGGDWMGLIKEALNMRTAHSIYKSLDTFLVHADKDGFDESIDNDFRSGVVLGTGMSSLMLSLLPGKVLRVAEMFGFAGDRKTALRALMSAGGWSDDSDEPSVSAANEGIRRPVCDMILLTYHLVISVLVPVGDVDIPMARKILSYNLERYPNGVFFLYFKSRLHTSQCEPELANATLQTALDLKLEYLQLQHMCLWDFACNSLMLSDWRKSLECFRILKTESNWSKATYMYATAACMGELVNDGNSDLNEEMAQILNAVPGSTKKIAGKSLPIEKFVSRKARKYVNQEGYLLLPALEIAYIFGSLSHTPPRLLLKQTIPRIDAALDILTGQQPDVYRKGTGHYWDDFCLVHFLRGVAYSFATYPRRESSAARDVEQSDADLQKGAREAEASFAHVLANGGRVKLDHWIIYHTHFELGQLYAKQGDPNQARHQFELVMSGKPLEVDHHAAKAQGKYSLESALQLKTHAALQNLA